MGENNLSWKIEMSVMEENKDEFSQIAATGMIHIW